MPRIVYDGEYPADYSWAEKMAEWERWEAETAEELRRFYWKRAGRPSGPEEDYLPRDLWKK